MTQGSVFSSCYISLIVFVFGAIVSLWLVWAQTDSVSVHISSLWPFCVVLQKFCLFTVLHESELKLKHVADVRKLHHSKHIESGRTIKQSSLILCLFKKVLCLFCFILVVFLVLFIPLRSFCLSFWMIYVYLLPYFGNFIILCYFVHPWGHFASFCVLFLHIFTVMLMKLL